MKELVILLAMIFCHIVDDYYLQGVLASMKQKSWWKKQESYCEKYAYDYIMALIMHAFSWACMINLPLLLQSATSTFLVVSVITNTTIHAIIDHLKANKKAINLVQDQLLHIAQILVTWIVFIVTI